jgi:hypothetical protein
MENINNILEVPNPADIENNKPSKSRFLFLLFFFGLFLFVVGCSYALYNHKYSSNAGVKVPESTKYDPKYK